MEKEKNLTGKTISGIGWSTAAKFSRQAVQLLFQVLLARILGPEEFGLVAMVIAFTTLADIIKNMGFGQALVHKATYDEGHLSTVFWFNVLLGLIVTGILQVTAPLIASFYREPKLTAIIRWFSIITLIGSANIVQEALLQKKLELKRLFFMEIISVTISGVLALVLALRGYGVWSLVIQFISISLISAVILWFTSSWRPSWLFRKGKFNELKKFGFNLLGHDLLNYVSRNIDTFLIGKFIGANALGIYSRAFVLMFQPLNLINQVLARVMFPVFSLLQGKPDQLKRAYLKATNLVAFVLFPVVVFMLVAARPLIMLVLGEKWVMVAQLLQIFSAYCLLDTIGFTTSWLYKSLGRTDIMFRWALYYTIVFVTAIVIGMRWGITGVAYAYSIAYVVFLWLPGWYIAFRLIGLSLQEMFRNLAGAFISSVLMGLVVWWLYRHVVAGSSIIVQVAMLLLAAVPAYLAFSVLINKSSLRQTRRLIRKKYSIG